MFTLSLSNHPTRNACAHVRVCTTGFQIGFVPTARRNRSHLEGSIPPTHGPNTGSLHRQGGEGSKAKATAIFVLPRTAYVLFVLEARKAAAKSNEVGAFRHKLEARKAAANNSS